MTLISRSSFLALVLMMFTVSAQAVVSLTPEFQKIEFEDKQKISGTIEVSNKGDDELTVLVQPEDWTDKQNVQRGGISWLKVKPKTFVLKPGEVQKVKFKAKTPKDAQAQYVTQIFFATRTQQHSSMGIGVRIASLIHWVKKQK
jgi:P pilus assembly chaperone PapD